MNADDKAKMVADAAAWTAKYLSPESQQAADRVREGTATLEERMQYAQDEIMEAMQVLPPNAPDGRHEDGFHAGCCAFRAWGEIMRVRRDVAKLVAENARLTVRVAEAEAWSHSGARLVAPTMRGSDDVVDAISEDERTP